VILCSGHNKGNIVCAEAKGSVPNVIRPLERDVFEYRTTGAGFRWVVASGVSLSRLFRDVWKSIEEQDIRKNDDNVRD